QPLDLGLQAFDLGRLLGRDAGAGPVVDLGLGQPAPHGLARDALLASDRGGRRGQGGVLLGVLAQEPHAPRAQLGIDLPRLPVHPLGLKQQRHQTRADSICLASMRVLGHLVGVCTCGAATRPVLPTLSNNEAHSLKRAPFGAITDFLTAYSELLCSRSLWRRPVTLCSGCPQSILPFPCDSHECQDWPRRGSNNSLYPRCVPRPSSGCKWYLS